MITGSAERSRINRHVFPVQNGNFTSAGNLPDVIDRFLDYAADHPLAPAVIDRDNMTTYAMLEDRARMFAQLFTEHHEPSVLLVLSPGTNAYAAMLGAAMAGGYYVPVNVASPPGKWLNICKLVQPDFIVGPIELINQLLEIAPGARGIDPATCDYGLRFAGRGMRHRTAYIIFTSGSTGEPKGVTVARAGLDHYVDWISTSRLIRPGDRVSQYANVAFDLSVLEIYGALCCGASLHPAVGFGDRVMPARMVEREQITVWISVPSVISLMMRSGEVTYERLNTVSRFVFCGEPLLATQVSAIFKACPHATVENTYGPTEATVSVTSTIMTSTNFPDEGGTSVALGEPIGDMDLLLLGGQNADEGEIVLVGPQLAQGYWGDQPATERAFRMIQRGDQPHRAYFSGDWAERRRGRVYFKQRLDTQVKVKGFRIELDEVVSAIMASGFPAVCVFKHEERLVAIVESALGFIFDRKILREELVCRLDRYAIPEDIYVIDRLPRNDNDKIDSIRTKEWFLAESGSF